MDDRNKNHWYDGLFYDKIIAPNQDKAFDIIKSIIENNTTVLDAGCGTGRLVFQLSDKCKQVIGIDLSRRNIKLAKELLTKDHSSNIFFHHTDVQSYLAADRIHFDYSIVSYVIHEIDEDRREKFLKALAGSSERIIIADYLFPRPKCFTSFLNEAIEFAAGSGHYKNFKSFIAGAGILGLAERTDLLVEREIKNSPMANHIVILKNKC